MADPTESIRREMVEETNTEAVERASLEARHGEVWDTSELQQDFEVLGFLAPFVVVRRRCDGQRGSLRFQHGPRFYFGWQPE